MAGRGAAIAWAEGVRNVPRARGRMRGTMPLVLCIGTPVERRLCVQRPGELLGEVQHLLCPFRLADVVYQYLFSGKQPLQRQEQLVR